MKRTTSDTPISDMVKRLQVTILRTYAVVRAMDYKTYKFIILTFITYVFNLLFWLCGPSFGTDKWIVNLPILQKRIMHSTAK